MTGDHSLRTKGVATVSRPLVRRQTSAASADLTRVTAFEGGKVYVLRIPSPEAFIARGIRWGRFDTMFTPAYWRTQVWFQELADATRPGDGGSRNVQTTRSGTISSPFALGRTLREE